MKKIVIVAGDKSGDLYGGRLCANLKQRFIDVEIFSFGGNHLAQHSSQIIDLISHSVTGIFEVLSSLTKLLRIFKNTIDEITKINPDLIILIDFPDFNLRLAKKLNKKYPLFYYISPQVWAWRKKRIEQIKKYVDKMIVIFKFEQDFYKKENMDVLFFGHPLLEIIEKKNTIPKKVISFMPGSRKNEIKKHLPIMIEAKKILEKELTGYAFRIIRPENITEDFYKNFSLGMEIIPHSYPAMEESAFIIAASGTATIEIAILEAPFLIIYKVHPLTWQILKKIVKTDFIGMVNILSGKKIIEEFLQEKATAQNIAEKTLSFLKNPKQYDEIKSDLKKIKETLSPFGAIEKFSEFIGEYLKI